MEWTRRELGALVTSGLLSGCAGVGVPSVPDPLADDGSSASAGTSTPGDPEANATAAGTDTATPIPDGPGTATRRVFAELEWFATRYDAVTDEFRALAGRMRSLATSLSRRSSIDEEAVATLERVAGRVETVAYDRLGPHFDTSPSIRSFNREQVDRVETLRARSDWDAAAAVLSDIADRYGTYESESYVERTFPRDPVRGPFVDYVTGTDDADDVLVMGYHAESGVVVRGQRGEDPYGETPPGGLSDVNRYHDLFGPLAARPEAGGESSAYLTVSDLVGRRTVPLSLRRYSGGETAEAAMERLLDGGVTVEETVRLGGRDWRRVLYRSADDVVYAEVTRAGPFLVAAAPSRTAWEDRDPDWRAPMEATWLHSR